jgi:hypothetical protein
MDDDTIFAFSQPMLARNCEISAGDNGPARAGLSVHGLKADVALLQGRAIDFDGSRNAIQTGRAAATAAEKSERSSNYGAPNPAGSHCFAKMLVCTD